MSRAPSRLIDARAQCAAAGTKCCFCMRPKDVGVAYRFFIADYDVMQRARDASIAGDTAKGARRSCS